MGVHETSVNFRKLIQDLADMYPFEVCEVVIAELVANSLDAHSVHIRINYDPSSKVLVLADDGNGMDATEFEKYHDFAAALKERGTGIGFAGLGAKISFNIGDRVVTQTRGDTFEGGSDWHLYPDGRLLWEDVPAEGLAGRGTMVKIQFRPDTHISYSTREELVAVLKRHYLPLFNSHFLDLYARLGIYSKDLRFVVNGEPVEPDDIGAVFTLDEKREFVPKAAGRRVGYGIFGLASLEYPVGQDRCGVLLCTMGKVIKADLFNQFPGEFGPRIFGLVEVPGFVEFLTSSKTDFLRGPATNQQLEKLLGPVRKEFKAWLASIGIEAAEPESTKEAATLEREIRQLLDDLPELSEFFGFRSRKQVLVENTAGQVKAEAAEGTEITYPVEEGIASGDTGPLDVGADPGQSLAGSEHGTQTAGQVSRRGRRGPKIGFFPAPDKTELSWVDGNSVIINSGHPSFEKVRSSRSAKRVHNLFAIAVAIQRFRTTGASADDLIFTDRLLAAWGKK